MAQSDQNRGKPKPEIRNRRPVPYKNESGYHRRNSVWFSFNGNSLVHYDMNHNKLNGVFYEGDNIENLTMTLELLIDRTSVEVFADNGKFTNIAPRSSAKNNTGFGFFMNNSEIKNT